MGAEIRVYDKNHEWVDATERAESIIFNRDLYGTGTFEIHISPDLGARLFRRGNIIAMGNDGHKAGIVRNVVLDMSRGKCDLAVFGDMPDGMTRQRIVVPPTKAENPTAYGYERINSDAETAIKHFARRNMTESTDAERNFDRLTIAENRHRGKTFPWQARYTNLAEEMKDICTYAEIGYEIYLDLANDQWVFDVIAGTDRSTGQTANEPIIFQPEHSNLGGYKYSEDFTSYRNTGYAGGAGDDENRLIYTLGADNAGSERVEAFLDCSGARDITELLYYGNQRLSEHIAIQTIEADTLPKTFTFGKDYFFGDKVTLRVQKYGIQIDAVVAGVRETWERATGYRTEIRFGERLPNLFSLINKKEVVR